MGRMRKTGDGPEAPVDPREAGFEDVTLPKHLRPLPLSAPLFLPPTLPKAVRLPCRKWNMASFSHRTLSRAGWCAAWRRLVCLALSPIEILILHSIRHRDREKLADICLVLDIEDTHIATYAIRKLEKAGLLTTGKAAKEKTVKITAKGAEACAHYAQISERLLVDSTANARRFGGRRFRNWPLFCASCRAHSIRPHGLPSHYERVERTCFKAPADHAEHTV